MTDKERYEAALHLLQLLVQGAAIARLFEGQNFIREDELDRALADEMEAEVAACRERLGALVVRR